VFVDGEVTYKNSVLQPTLLVERLIRFGSRVTQF